MKRSAPALIFVCAIGCLPALHPELSIEASTQSVVAAVLKQDALGDRFGHAVVGDVAFVGELNISIGDNVVLYEYDDVQPDELYVFPGPLTSSVSSSCLDLRPIPEGSRVTRYLFDDGLVELAEDQRSGLSAEGFRYRQCFERNQCLGRSASGVPICTACPVRPDPKPEAPVVGDVGPSTCPTAVAFRTTGGCEMRSDLPCSPMGWRTDVDPGQVAWVDSFAPLGGDGSQAAPYRTLQQAIEDGATEIAVNSFGADFASPIPVGLTLSIYACGGVTFTGTLSASASDVMLSGGVLQRAELAGNARLTLEDADGGVIRVGEAAELVLERSVVRSLTADGGDIIGTAVQLQSTFDCMDARVQLDGIKLLQTPGRGAFTSTRCDVLLSGLDVALSVADSSDALRFHGGTATISNAILEVDRSVAFASGGAQLRIDTFEIAARNVVTTPTTGPPPEVFVTRGTVSRGGLLQAGVGHFDVERVRVESGEREIIVVDIDNSTLDVRDLDVAEVDSDFLRANSSTVSLLRVRIQGKRRLMSVLDGKVTMGDCAMEGVTIDLFNALAELRTVLVGHLRLKPSDVLLEDVKIVSDEVGLRIDEHSNIRGTSVVVIGQAAAIESAVAVDRSLAVWAQSQGTPLLAKLPCSPHLPHDLLGRGAIIDPDPKNILEVVSD